MIPKPGETFGAWTIQEIREIAGDGFEARAVDAEGREVCLWAGAVGAGSTDEAVAAVRTRLSRIYHASLPRVLSGGVEADRAIVTVQAYRGPTLAQRLADGPMDAREALDRIRAIAAGLVKAHRAGVVHGFVAPEEIVLAEDGRTLLPHLGLADLLTERPRRAPEASREPSADVFGLSRCLVHALEGQDPLAAAGKDPGDWAGRTADDFDPALPEGLRRLLGRALLPDAERRLRHAEELAGDLGVIAASWQTLTEPPPRPTVPMPAVSRIAIAGGIVVAVLALLMALRAC